MARKMSLDDRWKFLIGTSIVLSVISLWIAYSQSVYISEIASGNSGPKLQNTPTTALVTNPFSGSFVLPSSNIFLGVVILLLVVLIIAFITRKR